VINRLPNGTVKGVDINGSLTYIKHCVFGGQQRVAVLGLLITDEI